MSQRTVKTWWFVEGGSDWTTPYMVGCNYDNLADASEFADRLRKRHPDVKYRVVRIESIREIEDEA
jgi:hypothetical protein